MKRWLVILLMLVTVCSCERDVLSPKQISHLHRTWLRTQTFQDGRDVTPNKALTFRVEFRLDGQLLYGTQKTLGGCCNPSHFNIEGESVTFSIDTSDPTLFCAQSLCVSTELTVGVRWHITALTDRRLTLTNEKTTLIFEPAP